MNLPNLKSTLFPYTTLFRSLIIVDSLNGLFNLLNRKKEVGKIVTSIIMLLTSIAQITNSYVVVASMVRYKKEEGWIMRSEEHTSELQSLTNLVCRLLLEKKK